MPGLRRCAPRWHARSGLSWVGRHAGASPRRDSCPDGNRALVADPRPAKISFTGSPPVGARIVKLAGLKRVTLELGNNSGTIFRVDHMPYGGNRMSGIGREGVRFAVEEMTNLRMVSLNLET
jgi:acyl-CoA reductase-like NAD-dependent aldehyde dehydrogenase